MKRFSISSVRPAPAWLLLSVALGVISGCAAGNGSTPPQDAAGDLRASPDGSPSACANILACGTCVGATRCGWCVTNGTCMPGDAIGSDDQSCTGAAWDITGDLCGSVIPDAGMMVDTGPPPPHDAGHPGPCVPTVAAHGENTNALCSNGIDDDCNGYIDCNDYRCSRNAAVTVCSDGGTMVVDSGIPPHDAGPPGAIGPTGGTVDLFQFAAFGDVRPPSDDATSSYPTSTIQSVFQGMQDLGAQFAVGSGDYMFASNATSVSDQIGLFLSAESVFSNHVFHAMGNHECTGAVASNCPAANETANVVGYMSRLAADYSTPYFDFMVHTRLGDAHFIATAPNAWSTAQSSWLASALAQSAMYTFVMEHESPNAIGPPAGATAIESMIDARAGGITLKLYGHTHEYHHLTSLGANSVVDGNAGAPLASTTSGAYFGFGIVQQRADGNVVFTAYQIGAPPMVMDSFVVTPTGAATR